MGTSADLPDLKVWLALEWPEHSHHKQAVHYWEQQAAEQVLFCAVSICWQAPRQRAAQRPPCSAQNSAGVRMG